MTERTNISKAASLVSCTCLRLLHVTPWLGRLIKSRKVNFVSLLLKRKLPYKFSSFFWLYFLPPGEHIRAKTLHVLGSARKLFYSFRLEKSFYEQTHSLSHSPHLTSPHLTHFFVCFIITELLPNYLHDLRVHNLERTNVKKSTVVNQNGWSYS